MGGSSNVRDDPSSTNHPSKGRGFRQLSDEEYNEKKMKGCVLSVMKGTPQNMCARISISGS